MATTYSQLGNLEQDRGGSLTVPATWHVKALATRLRLGIPQVMINLRILATYRRELGTGSFATLLNPTVISIDLAETVVSLLDEMDASGDGMA
jgi:hypothetical protein